MHRIHTYIVLITIILTVSACGPSLEEKQASLAKELGVESTIGARQGPFPLGYYRIEVSKGTSLEKAHSIIKGYEKVYKCHDHIEIYYYYSSSDNEALRVQVGYDEKHQVIRVDGEDSNSRVISIEDCFPGRIGD